MTADPGICVITPTVRNPKFIEESIRNADANGFDTDRLFVLKSTEDFRDRTEMEGLLDRLGVDGAVFGGHEREQWYKKHGVSAYSDVVPAASHAETSFGPLYM